MLDFGVNDLALDDLRKRYVMLMILVSVLKGTLTQETFDGLVSAASFVYALAQQEKGAEQAQRKLRFEDINWQVYDPDGGDNRDN